MVEAHKNTSPVHNFRPLFIFTSGILIYGPNVANTMVDETMVPNPLPEVVPRKKFEEKVLQSESVRGVVIRPGFVYGGSGTVNPCLSAIVLTNSRRSRGYF